MTPRPVLIIHPQLEERARLKAILGEGENQYLEASSRQEAGPLLSPPPSLVIAHHHDFKRLITDLDRKAPGAIRVVLSPAGDSEALEELELIAASGFEFLTVDSDATWKLKGLVRRRASPRHVTSVPVDATIVTGGQTIHTTCIDISNEGVGLLVPTNTNLAGLMPGESVMLATMRRGKALLMEQVGCSVQTVRRVEGTNSLHLGAVFETPTRPAQVPRLSIKSPLRIGALLRSASRLDVGFTVGSDDGALAQQFATGELKAGMLHLGEPSTTQRLRWQPGQAVTISFELNGRQLCGYAGVMSVAGDELVIAIPQALVQVHRRSSLRVPSGAVKATLTLVSPLSGLPVTRTVLDLSAIGASFRVDPAIDVFPPGLQLDDVQLEIGARSIQLSAIIASIGRAGGEDDGERRCGLQFTSIEPGGRQFLMDLLVRHRVEGVECGSGTPFTKIWDFFHDEGAVWRDHTGPDSALVPAKTHDLLGDGAHGLSKTFVLVQDDELAGHSSGLRIYSRTWLSQHLMVKTGFHRAATLSQQLMCLSFDYGEALPDVEYVRGLWRVSNRWAERIYGAASVRLLRPGLAYRCRIEPMRLSLDRPLPPGKLRVREAGPDDESAFLALLGASEDPLKLLSDDLVPGEFHLESLSRRYGALGLQRGRSLTVVEDRHGAPLGWALLETMSHGLFWAEMYDSFRFVLIDPSGPNATEARRSLAAHAAAFYARLGRKEAECHVAPTDLADLETLGFVGLGPLWEVGLHRSVVRELTSQMISVFARIHRREKERGAQLDPAEGERPNA